MNTNKTHNMVQVLDENYKLIGHVSLRFEEVRHFDSCGSVPAKIALYATQIESLGIDDNDHIYIRRIIPT